jgi:hypothetical protein
MQELYCWVTSLLLATIYMGVWNMNLQFTYFKFCSKSDPFKIVIITTS